MPIRETPPTKPGQSERELSAKSIGCGLLFGALFGAANAYLGLKAGLTVSTSIPIAVLSAAAFRLMGGGTILEANLSQTIGSASSSLAAGTIFTIPALFMWGARPTYVQVAVLALLGGLLGILAMVPLRRLLIVQADAELPYPEGRACAEVLKNAKSDSVGGKWIFIGLAVGAVMKLLISGWPLLSLPDAAASGLRYVPEELRLELPFLPNGIVTLSIDAGLIAVGFIVGYRAASVMVAGGLLAALVLYPLVTKLHAVGAGTGGGTEIAQLTFSAAKSGFVRYIGIGAVAVAGLITVLKTAPTMGRSFAAVARGLKRGANSGNEAATDRDVPAIVLLIGLVLLGLVLAFAPGVLAGDLPVGVRIAAAGAVVLFGFLFVPVSSRLVGVIGVSSNPTSAMALITLAGTSLFFVMLGRAEDPGTRAAVLTVGTVVCVAASKAGDISQDLKTGWLVGATPARQQIGQIAAALVSSWVVAAVVMMIGSQEHGGFTGPDAMPAPQANMMKAIVEAVVGGSLPWDLVAMGGGITLVSALLGLAPLQIALGIYLPLSTMTAIFVGGCLRRLIEARAKGDPKAADGGVLCASGFIAGVGMAGVALVAYAFFAESKRIGELPAPHSAENVVAFALLCVASLLLVKSAVPRAAAG
ncbi:MAG: oligopeptide transporter, OPT family [Planctomycetes bacterium]|nr:oligopeptide transporter, OPT family [Planctomycetota bacterium]